MRYKATLKEIIQATGKSELPEPLHIMVEMDKDFTSLFYVTYNVDEKGWVAVEDVAIDSDYPEYKLFGVEPLSILLDDFIMACVEEAQ